MNPAQHVDSISGGAERSLCGAVFKIARLEAQERCDHREFVVEPVRGFLKKEVLVAVEG